MTSPAEDDDYHDRWVDARNAWDGLHRWVAYHRGATIAADAVLARMDQLARDTNRLTPELDQ